jgi:uncharacterized membrane protein (DUF106 family)
MNRGIKIALFVMVLGIIFSMIYPKVPILKESVHYVLDPTFGRLLDYNVNLGLILITAFMTLVLTLVQKFTTNQEELRKLKQEQKLLQHEMKQYRDHPEKLLELQKKQLEFMPRTLDLTMGSLAYTTIPILLFFRWFTDYFTMNPVKIFGFMGWIWAYILFSIIFSMFYRKIFDMP